MKQLNLGILGCGRIAHSTHLPVLSAMPNVKIVALAEPDSALRDRAWRSHRQLLAAPTGVI